MSDRRRRDSPAIRPSTADMLVASLRRIRDVSHDLAHELTRRDARYASTSREMAQAIKRDIDVVRRALNSQQP
jgi:hypothetical protein